MTILGIFSVIVEAVIAGIGVQIATRKKKPQTFGWLLACTYIAYVVYDLSKMFNLSIESNTLDLLFSLATISAFFAIWQIKEKK